MLSIHADRLQAAAKDFYNTTGIQIVLYDEQETLLYAYPDTLCAFCAKIRERGALAQQCLDCDRMGFDACRAKKGIHIYRCFMGLTEATAPIMENGVIIGYMMMGQVLDHANRAFAMERIAEVAQAHRLPQAVLADALQTVPCITREKLASAANLMSMCACYLWVQQIISVQEDVLLHQIKDFVKGNLSQELTVRTICDRFYIFKSTLYKLSAAAFGMGISDYIKQLRLEQAKKLLCSSQMKISDIAVQVGIPDANYFTRCFAKHFGMTPRACRTAAQRTSGA